MAVLKGESDAHIGVFQPFVLRRVWNTVLYKNLQWAINVTELNIVAFSSHIAL